MSDPFCGVFLADRPPGYDKYGYDKYGYDKYGYDKYGYDKYGYNKGGLYRFEGQAETSKKA